MATDPVCKMQVDEKSSPQSSYEGREYYFCGSSCKTVFDKNPAKYA